MLSKLYQARDAAASEAAQDTYGDSEDEEHDFLADLPETLGEETVHRLELSIRRDLRKEYGDRSHPSGLNAKGRELIDTQGYKYSDPQVWDVLRTVG